MIIANIYRNDGYAAVIVDSETTTDGVCRIWQMHCPKGWDDKETIIEILKVGTDEKPIKTDFTGFEFVKTFGMQLIACVDNLGNVERLR